MACVLVALGQRDEISVGWKDDGWGDNMPG